MRNLKRPLQSIKVRMYGNVRMLSPDGETLAFVDTKRGDWYVKRGLAIREEGNTVRLNFVPEGHPEEWEKRESRGNYCVVCGTTEELTKHHIVPRTYRRRFPEKYKSRSSHDVVMMCINCHDKYEDFADELKRALEKETGIQYGRLTYDNDNEKTILLYMRGLARSLLRHGDKMPPERKKELEKLLDETKAKLKTKYDLPEDLESLSTMDCKEPLWEQVMDETIKKLIAAYDITEFIMRWRQHFITCMQPKFMPKDWQGDKIKTFRTRKDNLA